MNEPPENYVDPISVTFLKLQNYRKEVQINGCWGGLGLERGREVDVVIRGHYQGSLVCWKCPVFDCIDANILIVILY